VTKVSAATDTWDSTVAASFDGGSGTEADPYRIATGAQLAYLSSTVGAGTDYSGLYLKLTADIDLNNLEWTPIGGKFGGSNTSFLGTFDGDGHVIRNLTIENSQTIYTGLFGIVGDATIKNLGVENIQISYLTTNARIGGLVGYNWGYPVTIINCYTTGTITAGQTGQSVSNVRTGGIMGYSTVQEAILSNSYSTVDVTINGNGGKAGGLLGRQGGTGVDAVLISNSYATGVITQNGTGGNIGGLVGWQYEGTINNSYWNSSTNPTGVGLTNGGTGQGTAKSDTDMKDGAFVTLLNQFSGPDTEWSSDVSSVNGGYPVLSNIGAGRIIIQDSTVSPTTAVFDKYVQAANYSDVTTTLTPNGNTLSAVRLGATPLTENTNYTVSGNDVMIKKEYLATLGTGAQVFSIDMSAGIDPTLTVTISDTTPPAPTITAQPSNTAVNPGSDASFSVTATGSDPLTYQWQVDSGSGFGDITAETSATLTLNGVTAALNGNAYRVVITDTNSLSTTSTSATLTVNEAPTITAQPSNTAVNPGSDASFSVTATGSDPLTYQWQVDSGTGFGDITAETSATLTLNGVTAPMNGNAYRVIITDTNSLSTTSTSATLTVNEAPTITAQPSNTAVNPGSDASYSVTATGSGPLTYQWQVDSGTGFGDITAETSATLTLNGVTAPMNGNAYRVIITDTNSLSTTSTAATLTVNEAPTITAQPSNTAVNPGSDASFSVTATGSDPLTYQWQVDSGSGFGDITAETSATLTLNGVTAALNGNAYRVIITDTNSLSTTSTAATLTVNEAPTITAQPSNTAVNPGSDASFSVTATGSDPLTYQWQVDSGTGFGDITAETSATLTLNGVTAALNGNAYRVIITDTNSLSTTSTSATLTVNEAPTITAQPSNTTVNPGSDASFSVTATGSDPLTYQWQVDSGTGFGDITAETSATLTLNGVTAALNGNAYRVVITDTNSLSTTSTSATLTVNEAPTITEQPSNTTVNPGNNANFSVTATGSDPLTYQWQLDNGTGFANLADETSATLTLNGVSEPMNGYAYRVVITDTNNLTTTSSAATLAVIPNVPPVLTADSTENDTIHTIAITFTDDAAWRGAITSVKVGSTALHATDYSVTEGTIIINAGILDAGSHSITVVATHYADASVMQSVNLQDRPANPQNLTAVDGNRTIDLSWDTVTSATYYNVYMSEVQSVYDGNALVTVTDATYQISNLSNGTTYYFVVKAGNPGGLSAESNEASATPATVPAAPTHVVATAGRGSATITFDAPGDNGGSAITGFEVFDDSHNLVATASAGVTSIQVTGLSNSTAYTFTVRAMNAKGSSDPSAPSNVVTPSAPSSSGGSSNNDTSSQAAQSGIDILVNGKVESIGTATTITVNGQEVTTIAIDEEKLRQRLEAEGEHAVITIAIASDSEVIVGELTGLMVKDLENQQAVVVLRTEKAAYTLPAAQINVDAISERFGDNLALQDIKIRIEIAEPLTDSVEAVEEATAREGLTLVAPPINFKVTAVYEESTEEVTSFNAYVERTIAIPDGVDPNRITTGVVVEPDGTVRHVPTKVVEQAGNYYAHINSLTNSTYALVWHPMEFKDMTHHWAQDTVTNMGSRLVVEGTGNSMFSPDRDITRAEFAAIVVRGLGLRLEHGDSEFTDVQATAWFSDAVQTAYAHGFIQGFEDGTFRPHDKITREQAMSIIANAMKLIEWDEQYEGLSTDAMLLTFDDAEDIASWAVSNIAITVQAGIVSGRSSNELAPQEFMTRAEVATIIERLLKRAELI